MKRFLIPILSLWLVLAASAHAKEPITIAAFGDSLVAGYGLPAEDSFPAQLERKLRADGHDVKVLNDGVSGDTTAGGVARIPYVLAQMPSAVIIVLGGNDLLQGLPPDAMKANLATIIAQLEQHNIQVLLTGLKAPPALGARYVSAYNAAFPALARQYKTGYYPVYLQEAYGNPQLMQPDGTHPNKAGVAVIVNAVYPLVTKLIAEH